MGRVCTRLLISTIWVLGSWLIIIERRTPRKGLDSGKVSNIIGNGLAVFFGQPVLDARKSWVR